MEQLNWIEIIGLPGILLGSFLIIVSIIGIVYLSRVGQGKLDRIKAKEVGDGQHGTDKILSEKEFENLFSTVVIPKVLTDMSDEWKPGRVLHFKPSTREAIIDTTDTHAAVEAPTEVGKTTTYVVPNIQYNMMASTSMILPCIKPELIELIKDDAEKLGYEVGIIDFNNPSDSLGFDFFNDIVLRLKAYEKTKNPLDLAEAESLAGKLAKDIIQKKDTGASESSASSFFYEASYGLIHAVILLVALYGKKNEIHFSSVRSIIQDILMQEKSEGKKVDSKIKQLFDGLPNDFGPKKHVGAAFAATNETEDNVYASVLGDLRAMGDTLAEQVISVATKKDSFDYRKLVNGKYILFIHMPETKSEFFVFAKLIIKKITTQLAIYALEHHSGKLPRVVKIIWDEFGLSPKIEEFENEMAIDRGKGILFDLIYQDPEQIKLKYGESAEKIIRRQCASEIVLGIAPTNTERAKELSEAIGTKTIMSGSVSRSRSTGQSNSTSSSITEDMKERPLLTVGEILRMEELNKRLVFRRGKYPFLAYFPSYYKKEWGLSPGERNYYKPQEGIYYPVDYYSFDDLQDSLDKLKKDNGIFTNSTLDVEFIREPLNEDDDPFIDLMNKISQITERDVEALSLLDDRKYPAFMKYMQKYNSKITRFELQSMLESIVE